MLCFSDSSAAQEMLAIWLVVVVGIAAAVEFLVYFCTFWNLLVYFSFLSKGEGGVH